MAVIHLVIADKDRAYLDSLVDFIYSKYNNRFYVQAFSNEDTFNDFFNKTDKIDILLISPDFYSDELDLEKVVAPIVLSAGILTKDIKNCEIISKYQMGDKLVGNILNIFSEKSNCEFITGDGKKKTRFVTFYSPCGGAGTSTLAAGVSVKCVQSGLNAFYLNFEKIAATTAYFDAHGSGENLSKVLFFLKENNKNLALKIEGSRSIDSTTGVHYFLPPENVFDLDELTSDEIKRLIGQFKAMESYDVVIADTGSELNNVSISLLESSDLVFCVLPCDTTAKIKLATLHKAFDILNKRKGLNFEDKMELILNKCLNLGSSDVESLTLNGKPASVRIPYIKGLDASYGIEHLTEDSNPLGQAVRQIISILQGSTGGC